MSLVCNNISAALTHRIIYISGPQTMLPWNNGIPQVEMICSTTDCVTAVFSNFTPKIKLMDRIGSVFTLFPTVNKDIHPCKMTSTPPIIAFLL